MKKKHTREKLFNTECELCKASAHSLDKSFTYVDLSIRDEPYRIRIIGRVCLGCGPMLVFEVDQEMSDYVEEALMVAGYDLNSKHIEVQTI